MDVVVSLTYESVTKMFLIHVVSYKCVSELVLICWRNDLKYCYPYAYGHSIAHFLAEQYPQVAQGDVRGIMSNHSSSW